MDRRTRALVNTMFLLAGKPDNQGNEFSHFTVICRGCAIGDGLGVIQTIDPFEGHEFIKTHHNHGRIEVFRRTKG